MGAPTGIACSLPAAVVKQRGWAILPGVGSEGRAAHHCVTKWRGYRFTPEGVMQPFIMVLRRAWKDIRKRKTAAEPSGSRARIDLDPFSIDKEISVYHPDFVYTNYKLRLHYVTRRRQDDSIPVERKVCLRRERSRGPGPGLFFSKHAAVECRLVGDLKIKPSTGLGSSTVLG